MRLTPFMADVALLMLIAVKTLRLLPNMPPKIVEPIERTVLNFDVRDWLSSRSWAVKPRCEFLAPFGIVLDLAGGRSDVRILAVGGFFREIIDADVDFLTFVPIHGDGVIADHGRE